MSFEVQQLIRILERTVSTDQGELEQAQQYLKLATEENLPEFLKALSEVLHNGENSKVARMAASLQLKNHLVAKDPAIKKAYQERWMTFPEDIRAYIKNNILLSLGTEDTRPSSAAQCVACVAVIEIPANQWPSVISSLTQNVTNPGSPETLKEASLEAIGYICEEIDPGALLPLSNEILTAIMQGMKSPEATPHLHLAATNALMNSLEFTRANFEMEVERNYIMQVVCETTQSKDIKVREAALECLVEIMSLYYHLMEPYMSQALFPITLEAMKSDLKELSLQGIEFWCTVAEEEIELEKDRAEAEKTGHPPTRASKFYAAGALQYLVPVVLVTLTKQDESDDEDAWNPSKAAGVCLELLAQCCGESIAQFVMPFVQEHMRSADWRYRDAALMAFGSIVVALPNKILEPMNDATVITLIESMRVNSVIVRDTAAWTFSRICRYNPVAIMDEARLKPVLEVLIQSLGSEPRVAANVCWAFTGLAEAEGDEQDAASSESEATTSILSPYFEFIVERILETTTRPDGDKANLRTAAYEALMDLIKYSPKDCYATVQKTTVTILERLNQILSMEQRIESPADRSRFSDVQSLLCASLQSILVKLTRDDALRVADQMMTAFLQIFRAYSDRPGAAQEDAILAVTALVEAIGEEFKKYMPFFKPYLCLSLSPQAHEVCCAAIGLTGDIFRTLKREALPYSDEIMTVLLGILADTNVHRSIKPEILAVFGEIALGIGAEFKKYVDPVLHFLHQASLVQVDTSDCDLYEWLQELHKGIMGAYSGIIQGLRSDDPNTCCLSLMAPHVPSTIQFMAKLATDGFTEEAHMRTWAGVIGDLCSFGPHVTSLLDVEPIRQRLSEGSRSNSRRTKKISTWAIKKIQENQPSSLACGDADRMEGPVVD